MLRLGLTCRAPIFFQLGRIDGPESYLAQLPDPVVRAAVPSLVEDAVHEVLRDPDSSNQAERLWLLLHRADRPADVPSSQFRLVAHRARELAALIEARATGLWRDPILRS